MKKQYLPIYLFICLFIFSCKSRKYSSNNKHVIKTAKENNPNPISYTTLSYIDAFKQIAIDEMNSYGIPASITLAQGILESGSGNSDLAKYANNHFGIKCTSDWKGKAFYKDDDQKDDCFRVYKDPNDSYRDHSKFLLRKRYAALFELDKDDYKNWAIGLKAAGYATNPRYADMLINIIEKYSLHQYDKPESAKNKQLRENRVNQEIKADTTKVNNSSPQKDSSKYYTVQPGDTLFRISQMFKLSVDELKTINQLSDNTIKVGQQILVVK